MLYSLIGVLLIALQMPFGPARSKSSFRLHDVLI